MNEKSCVGCKFLYGDGSGYSNYTWMDTFVRCALGKNPKLTERHDEPEGFAAKAPQDTEDKWPPTMNGRCERYASGVYIVLDPDREEYPGDTKGADDEQVRAICKADKMEYRAPPVTP